MIIIPFFQLTAILRLQPRMYCINMTECQDDTSDMSLEEVMIYFGVPEPSKVAIHKALHPAKGTLTASTDEKARRKAAHAVALERFERKGLVVLYFIKV